MNNLTFICPYAEPTSGPLSTAGQDRARSVKDILYIAIPILASLAAGWAALYGRAAGFYAGPNAETTDGTSAILMSVILLSILFLAMKRYPDKSARLIVAAMALAGTISGLILLRTSLQASGAPPVIFIITLPLGYLGLSWSVRGYFGSLSPKRTAGLVLASATLLGALIGTSLAPAVAITFLLGLMILDVVVVESNTMQAILGKTGYDHVISVVTLQLEKYVVGLGDFLAYSILACSALRILGLYGAIESSIFILLGVVGTFWITRKRGKAPGLLLPVVLGLIPVFVGSL